MNRSMIKRGIEPISMISECRLILIELRGTKSNIGGLRQLTCSDTMRSHNTIFALGHSNMRKQFCFHVVPFLIRRPKILVQNVAILLWVKKIKFRLNLIVLLIQNFRVIMTKSFFVICLCGAGY